MCVCALSKAGEPCTANLCLIRTTVEYALEERRVVVSGPQGGFPGQSVITKLGEHGEHVKSVTKRSETMRLTN